MTGRMSSYRMMRIHCRRSSKVGTHWFLFYFFEIIFNFQNISIYNIYLSSIFKWFLASAFTPNPTSTSTDATPSHISFPTAAPTFTSCTTPTYSAALLFIPLKLFLLLLNTSTTPVPTSTPRWRNPWRHSDPPGKEEEGGHEGSWGEGSWLHTYQ